MMCGLELVIGGAVVELIRRKVYNAVRNESPFLYGASTEHGTVHGTGSTDPRRTFRPRDRLEPRRDPDQPDAHR